MDTHLTPTNETVVREREQAMRTARQRAATASRARREAGQAHTTDGASRPNEPDAGRSPGGAGDVLVVTLFAVLASGLVSLVVTTLRV